MAVITVPGPGWTIDLDDPVQTMVDGQPDNAVLASRVRHHHDYPDLDYSVYHCTTTETEGLEVVVSRTGLDGGVERAHAVVVFLGDHSWLAVATGAWTDLLVTARGQTLIDRRGRHTH